MPDKTEFRIGRSHDDIIYHHVAGRDYRLDPRYAVCLYGSEARALVDALNFKFEGWTREMFELEGLRW